MTTNVMVIFPEFMAVNTLRQNGNFFSIFSSKLFLKSLFTLVLGK
jgi:hypothetical protein